MQYLTQEQLQADRAAQLQGKTHAIVMRCRYTDTVIGTVSVLQVAGYQPFITDWKNTQSLHPLFSMTDGALLKFARNTWDYFCSLTPEEAADVELTAKQERMLQVTALALLHKLTDVEQSMAWLPPINDVYNCWSSLIQLSNWKHWLESQRFSFPTLRISRNNQGINLQSYMQDCWGVKKTYESAVREQEEKEKLKSAEAALVGLRDDLVRKTPRSKRLLWRWLVAHMPARYDADMEGWMWTLYDAETYDEVSKFTMADIDMFEEIVLNEVNVDNSVSHAFLQKLAHKRKLLEDKESTYEIVIPRAIELAKAAGDIPETEPKQADYPTRVKFIVAHAKWRLAHTDISRLAANAAMEQRKVTVKTNNMPHSVRQEQDFTFDTDEDTDEGTDYAASSEPELEDEENQRDQD